MKHQISFYSHETEFSLQNSDTISQWISSCIDQSSKKSFNISYVLSNDEYVKEINRDFLEHDYYTDIITFPLEEEDGFIEADIYISIDRVRENASNYKVSLEEELRRVIIHGVLHLLGYADRSEEQKKLMRAKENEMLQMFPA